MRYIPRILPYLRPYWRLAVVSALVSIFSVLIALAVPWPLKFLVDNVLGSMPFPSPIATLLGNAAENQVALLLVVVLTGLVLTLAQNLLNVAGQYVNTKLQQRIILDFRSDLFMHTERLSVAYSDQIRIGSLMYGINFEAVAAGGVIIAIEPLARGVLTLIGMMWVSFQIDPTLALLSMTIVPFLYYAIGYYATHIQQSLLEVKNLESVCIAIVHDALSMIRVVAAFGREDYENNRFTSQGNRAVDARVNITVRQTLFSMAVSMSTAVGTAMVLGVGIYRAMHGELSIGQLLVVMSYIAAVYKPIEAISYTIGSLQDRITGLQMGFHVLEAEPVIQDQPGAINIGRARGDVRFESVSFGYPGRPDVLRDISFEVKAGQNVALVGPTGAGKTTLASLIPRFHDPSEGRVLLDGNDLRGTQYRALREQISLVPQDPVLFSGSVAENIRYGRLDASVDEVIEAAKAANAHEFTMALPRQYESEVGERGVQLSGGERQRICIARAFLKDAPVLILDEPTSSIDSMTESVILSGLERLMVGRTTFMIAHRLSTIRHADLILTLDHGRLVEQGTHDELMQHGGLYSQLYELHRGTSGRTSARPDFGGTLNPDQLADSPYRVEWLEHEIPAQMEAGTEETVAVTLRNASTVSWSSTLDSPSCANPIFVSYHWLRPDADAPVVKDGLRTQLPTDVDSGGEVSVRDVQVAVPGEPGSYRLEITLVHELEAWFEERGGRTLTVPVEVVFGPDQESPPTASAAGLASVGAGRRSEQAVLIREGKGVALGLTSSVDRQPGREDAPSAVGWLHAWMEHG